MLGKLTLQLANDIELHISMENNNGMINVNYVQSIWTLIRNISFLISLTNSYSTSSMKQIYDPTSTRPPI